jgi:flagella basal body P-ring formation protein FlgA
MRLWLHLCLLALMPLARGAAATAPSSTNATLALHPSAAVDSEGMFLNQLVEASANTALPNVRLGDAPGLGQVVTLTRAQVEAALVQALPVLATAPWTGPESIRVTRSARTLSESEFVPLLSEALEAHYRLDPDALELRLTRPWKALLVPAEPLRIRVLDLPTSGLSPHLILRFELAGPREPIGTFQQGLQIRWWRPVLMARTALTRGQTLLESDVITQRLDVLTARSALLAIDWTRGPYELAEPVQAGAPLTDRAVRPKPLIRRGQMVDAFVRDGFILIAFKVEALEPGAAGQIVRIRNIQTRRELRGKVLDDTSIQVLL